MTKLEELKEYPIEVRNLIESLVHLRGSQQTIVWSLATDLLRQWDHDRGIK